MVLLLAVPSSMPLRQLAMPRIVILAYQFQGIPYSWGGGHKERPGPSTGTCQGYTGKIKPCPAKRTRGLDCSGLARLVYARAHGYDVLGPGNTDEHLRRMRKVTDPRPGDLVFFGKRKTHHVGIYLGNGQMMNAPETGAVVRVDDVEGRKDLRGYYRL
ncbi:C40 family peptidase [Nonomuraea africana]|uniref:Cell wall-associated NlpC family hydrolase n=1 Tax=Nonomuraea africana TaxID=46171 RepID=A0ABR9KTX6_9ACTN|nr:C40 family peptidase [Nonomuraea africana]MBE1565048.1 cell wall-associated NlpC family hydrolase [Nonomuraea africana]